jgi:hypothetical protein
MDSEGQKTAREIGVTNDPIDAFNGTDERIATRQVDTALQFLHK